MVVVVVVVFRESSCEFRWEVRLGWMIDCYNWHGVGGSAGFEV